MKLLGILAALIALTCPCSLRLSGQASPTATGGAAAPDIYPDQGYLSPTRYVSRYFGFALDLPPDAQLAPVPQAVARDGRIQMLQLVGPPPAYATISIVAFPLRAKSSGDPKSILHKALEQELYMGVEELHGLSKTSIAGHTFYFFETRRGTDQHVALGCSLEGYALVVMLAANNEKMVKELQASFQQLSFLAPARARELAGADAKEYEGPAISSHHLALLTADPPANHIDAGEVVRDVYENHSLGFRYRIPDGWTLESQGAVQPAIERSRRRNYEGPWIGEGERELIKVCSRTLFSAWAKPPAGDGQLSYDDFGEVTVSASSMACFPGVNLPASSTNRRAIQNFLQQLRLTQPMLESMRDAKAFTVGDTLIVLLHGTVAFQVPDDPLSRRLSVAMTVTSRRGYLVTWFYAAPHDSELRDLLEERLAFDPEPAAKEANATTPGGGNGTPASIPTAPITSQPTQSALSSPGQLERGDSQSQAPASKAPGPNPADATPQEDGAAPTAASPPSLLRPGESPQEQQAKGQELPKQ